MHTYMYMYVYGCVCVCRGCILDGDTTMWIQLPGVRIDFTNSYECYVLCPNMLASIHMDVWVCVCVPTYMCVYI